jgi:hypothetical protein
MRSYNDDREYQRGHWPGIISTPFERDFIQRGVISEILSRLWIIKLFKIFYRMSLAILR